MPIKILAIFGTRPEAIKMLPLCRALLKNKEDFETKICVTAQHRQMLDQVLDIFDIQPDFDLDIMKQGQDLTDVTSSVLVGMRNIFSEYKPDLVLVHGDTTTTLASAMAAFYAKIPVGHVEAGLRTNDIFAPYPEEFNRQVVSRIATYHFAPTNLSRNNLESEGHLEESIAVIGNTVIDALFWVLRKLDSDIDRKNRITRLLSEQLPFDCEKTRYVLITGHRRENFGAGFTNICEAIAELAIRFPTTHFVYPVHLNPNVQEPVNNLLSKISNIHLTSPLDYEPFVYLLRNCYLVLTDSGGIQEEAPSLGKPVLVMRDVTERPEAVSAGTVQLVGADKQKIINEASLLLEDTSIYLEMTRAHNPYGDGHACDRIIELIKEKFCEEI